MGLLNQVRQPQHTAQMQAPGQAQQPMQQPQQVSEADAMARMKKVQNIALACQKMLYDSKLKDKFKPMLMDGNDPSEIAASVAHKLIMLSMIASKMEIDPNNVIPAGTIVVGDVLDFLEQARGIRHTDEQVELAIELFVRKMMDSVQGGAQ